MMISSSHCIARMTDRRQCNWYVCHSRCEVPAVQAAAVGPPLLFILCAPFEFFTTIWTGNTLKVGLMLSRDIIDS
jgi:hypothetical protein